MKEVCLDLSLSRGLGDTICATPVLRKLYNSYGKKIAVLTVHPAVFKKNPYVSELYFVENCDRKIIEENYEVLTSFAPNVQNPYGISLRHNQFDIRQFHASGLGFQLMEEDLEMEYYPDEYQEITDLPEKFIVIHPVQTWASRTWSKENWAFITKLLNDSGISVVSVGKDSSEIGNSNVQKPVFDFEIKNGLNLLNEANISQTWWLMQKSLGVITMDSGMLHLAGTTDANIFQLGSSVNYKLRAPFRKGSQNYKYYYISGECKIACASDMKYGVKYWESIKGIPSLVGCLENYKSFLCHPNVMQVYNKIMEII
jgi:ADP-heptose:LPS heptosyltransferase